MERYFDRNDTLRIFSGSDQLSQDTSKMTQ